MKYQCSGGKNDLRRERLRKEGREGGKEAATRTRETGEKKGRMERERVAVLGRGREEEGKREET